MTIHNKIFDATYARIAGVLYLVIAVAGVFSIAYVPSQLIFPSDATATAKAILGNRTLFNFGVLGDVIVILSEAAITAMLYFMFRQISPTLSLIAAFARLSMAGVMAVMLLFYAAALSLIDPSGNLAEIPENTRLALSALMFSTHDAGVWIWQLFFALHLAVFGWLVTRSDVYPRILGRMMTIGAFGYLLDSIDAFAAPETAWLTYPKIGLLVLVTVSEFSFALWLVLRGPRPK